jgi:hypothetical protein
VFLLWGNNSLYHSMRFDCRSWPLLSDHCSLLDSKTMTKMGSVPSVYLKLQCRNLDRVLIESGTEDRISKFRYNREQNSSFTHTWPLRNPSVYDGNDSKKVQCCAPVHSSPLHSSPRWTIKLFNFIASLSSLLECELIRHGVLSALITASLPHAQHLASLLACTRHWILSSLSFPWLLCLPPSLP